MFPNACKIVCILCYHTSCFCYRCAQLAILVWVTMRSENIHPMTNSNLHMQHVTIQNVNQSWTETFFIFASTLKMEAACSYKLLVSTYTTTYMCTAVETHIFYVDCRLSASKFHMPYQNVTCLINISHVLSKFFTLVGDSRVDIKTNLM